MSGIVVDPEDKAQMQDLAALHEVAWDKIRKANPDRVGTPTFEIFAEMLRLLESGYPRPKPEEPTGLGAVVVDGEGVKWVRTYLLYGTGWVPSDENTGRAYWSDIDAVEVLSQGVTA